jgi:hypothetical protein
VIAPQHVEVLEHRVGGALVPVLADLLLGRQQVDEFVEAAVEEAPAALQVWIRLCALYWVATPMRRMPELTQLDSVKSMMRNLPAKGTAGLERQSVSCFRRLPRPPASTSAKDSRVSWLTNALPAAPGGGITWQRPASSCMGIALSDREYDDANAILPIDRPRPGPWSRLLLRAREHDPFACLGPARDAAAGWRIRVFPPRCRCDLPGTARRRLDERLVRVDPARRLRVARRGAAAALLPAVVVGKGRSGAATTPTPFRRRPTPHDLYLFSEGRNYQAYRLLGARAENAPRRAGACFRVWAPNAERVSVVGDFNGWDGRVHPMASLGASGVWELFIPGLPPDTCTSTRSATATAARCR